MFFSDCSTENSLKESLTVLRNGFIVSVEFSNCFFQKHGINLFLPDRTCEHGYFIEYGNKIINNDILYFTIFIEAKLINSVWTESFSKDLFELLRMGSWNQNKGILELLVIGSKFLKTFCRMLFRIHCVFNYVTDSSPFNFSLVIFVCNGLIGMRKGKVDKVSLILLKLFEYFRVIDGLYFHSLPIFIFLVCSVLWKRNDLF